MVTQLFRKGTQSENLTTSLDKAEKTAPEQQRLDGEALDGFVGEETRAVSGILEDEPVSPQELRREEITKLAGDIPGETYLQACNRYEIGEETYGDLVEMGIRAKQQKEEMKWTLGDIARRLETHHGQHTLEEYAKAMGEDPSTLKRYRWVAGVYGEKVHRRTNLSFTHHQLVAARKDRLELLEKAESFGWSSKQLRKEISASKASGRRRSDNPGPTEPSTAASGWEPLRSQMNADTFMRLGGLIRALMEEVDLETLTVDECKELRDFCIEVGEFIALTELGAGKRLGQLQEPHDSNNNGDIRLDGRERPENMKRVGSGLFFNN